MNVRDIYFLNKALKVAQSSKDQSTKVGAFFMSEDGFSPLGFGYNGMPRGMPDNDPTKNERPEKYLWFEHAERNGIYNGAQPLMENAMIFSSHFLNMEAARAVVSVGLKTVVIPKHDESAIHYARVRELFQYAGVEIIALEDKRFIKNNGKLHKKYSEFMELTNEYAEDLAHPLAQTKSASLILNKTTYAPIGMGEAGPPPNLKVTSEHIQKDGVSFWIQESEKNAIFNVVRSKFKNCTAYVSWCPCAHCTLALASVATKKIVTLEPNFELEADKRWETSFLHSQKLLKEMNIELSLIPKKEIEFINQLKQKTRQEATIIDNVVVQKRKP